jgi:hypothetical protein
MEASEKAQPPRAAREIRIRIKPDKNAQGSPQALAP